MEVHTRMHEASYDLPTYPPQNFDPYTLSSRDFFSPTSNIPTYMASPHGHSTYSNLSSTRLFNGYTGTGLGGSFGGDAALYAHSSIAPLHASSSTQRHSQLQLQHSQYKPLNTWSPPRPSTSATTLPSTSTLLSASTSNTSSRRDTRRSPNGEAERAPQAAALYEQSQIPPSSLMPSRGGTYGTSTQPRLPMIIPVEKQQVTTSATQAASASRRRNEAHFSCPVPGCTSTFTRRFNLRGMSAEPFFNRYFLTVRHFYRASAISYGRAAVRM